MFNFLFFRKYESLNNYIFNVLFCLDIELDLNGYKYE